jgi:hypothetical protein
MHLSEIEKERKEKDHQMRYGYQTTRNNRFPHSAPTADERQYLFKDNENRHSLEMEPEKIPQNNYGPGAP